MNSQEKQEVVADLSAKFADAQAAFVVGYQGSTCQELTSLRSELMPLGSKFAVVKNTLAQRAVAKTPSEGLASLFEGPTGVVWASKDAVASAKVLAKFAKDKEHFSIKAGVVEGSVVDSAGVQELASMPSKEELLGKLLALMNAPATQLLRMLNAPASSLVRVLEAWRQELEKKQGKAE